MPRADWKFLKSARFDRAFDRIEVAFELAEPLLVAARDASLSWLAFGLLLAAWNAADDGAGPMQPPEATLRAEQLRSPDAMRSPETKRTLKPCAVRSTFAVTRTCRCAPRAARSDEGS